MTGWTPSTTIGRSSRDWPPDGVDGSVRGVAPGRAIPLGVEHLDPRGLGAPLPGHRVVLALDQGLVLPQRRPNARRATEEGLMDPEYEDQATLDRWVQEDEDEVRANQEEPWHFDRHDS